MSDYLQIVASYLLCLERVRRIYLIIELGELSELSLELFKIDLARALSKAFKKLLYIFKKCN